MTVLLLLVMVLMVMVVTTMITMISITTSMTRRGRIICLITGKMKMDMKKMNQWHLSETQPKQPKVTSNYTNSWAPQRCSGLAVGAKARLCGSLLVRCWSKATGSNEGALKQKSCLQWLDSLWVFPHGSFMEVCFKIRNLVKIMWKMMIPLPFWCNVLNRIVQSPSQILTIFRLKNWDYTRLDIHYSASLPNLVPAPTTWSILGGWRELEAPGPENDCSIISSYLGSSHPQMLYSCLKPLEEIESFDPVYTTLP